ncbi:cystathionine beta-lyase [Spiribacter insolitus]|uniref:Cystathionine beta-lyase n=1 Tax=Spiribacter insolitus TaxID=3122417 RepID=A0ABV3TCA1_9GAMM
MKRGTRLVHSARPPYADGRRPVNPPLVRASTVDFESMAAMSAAQHPGIEGAQSFTYGVRGTPTTFALETLITELENGDGTKLYSSGLEAIAAVLLAFLRPGDHLLVVDTVYSPVRQLLERFLRERGVHFDFYSPRESDLSRLIKPATRMIYTETPGSVTMELQDIAAIAETARRHGDILVACDNTWASGFCYRPLDHGADLSIVAGTKYLGGHSDVLMGSVTASGNAFETLHETSVLLGLAVSTDDAALVLRGARTLHIRYPAHARRALAVAEWLADREEVAAVHYPPLPESPDHALWASRFDGAAGLFSVELTTAWQDRVSAFVDGLSLFGRGASWGGFESLALPCSLKGNRSVDDWSGRGPLVRLQIGLEDAEDLIADLAQALDGARG